MQSEKHCHLAFGVSLLLTALPGYVYVTNPFHPGSIIQSPFTTTVEENTIVLHKHFSLHVRTSRFHQALAFSKAGAHILAHAYFGGHPARSPSQAEILHAIHQRRFDPTKPYLITGDQFSVFYPRNLGIFYHALLDPRIACSAEGWLNRQRIYLQSTAYALEAFCQGHRLATTLVPIGVQTVVPINIYAYPSDALYGVLYALSTLQDTGQLERLYPMVTGKRYPLATQSAAKALKEEYRDTLQMLLAEYIDHVYDPTTGLVRKQVPLASARDAVIRSSSFYDNVVFWATLERAQQLGLQTAHQPPLDRLKQRILETFWDEASGSFRDDLSESSLRKTTYSSDWLIVLSTGFLNLGEPKERRYAEQSVRYISAHGIDQPFALAYQPPTQAAKEASWVKLFVPSYGREAIWSYWGTEYIKLLILLYRETQEVEYWRIAQTHLTSYAHNIVKHHGFPEVYAPSGAFLRTAFYKSIRKTGWVIDYEQALALSQAEAAGIR
jgi:hypothetical protein